MAQRAGWRPSSSSSPTCLPDTGLAFVLVPHLEPTHKGMMPELLGRHTKMKVVEAEDGMEVQPNHVYVIPPNADLAILHGKLQVLEPAAPRGLRMPIDFFFRQLAADQKEKAIGIILSGMGSDGTLGLRAIKENFGHGHGARPGLGQVRRHAPQRHQHRAGGLRGRGRRTPRQTHPVRQPRRRGSPEDRDLPEGEASAALQKVFVLLRAHTGNDFSCYKNNTISRRIERRMSVHQFDSLPRYVRFLQENPQEVELLYKELLIGVTNFFRDPGLFDFLQGEGDSRLAPGPAERTVPLRVWNPGCSTGEETYSLAIMLKECLEDLNLQETPAIQIFATDIDHDAIEKARQGTFSASIAADLSPERLARFFLREGEGYRIKKEIRDLVIFAPQNILVDPPFTKLDILCCRNLLIYINAETQKKLLPLMHYALNPGGLLVLGTAESVGGLGHLFAPLDHKWKVFQRRELSERSLLEMPAYVLRHERAVACGRESQGTGHGHFLRGPAGAVGFVRPSLRGGHRRRRHRLRQRADRKVPGTVFGKVNVNVFAMAREGLREELGIAIHNAAKQKTTVTARGVRVKSNGGFSTINLTVRPLAESADLRGMFLVVFEEVARRPVRGRRRREAGARRHGRARERSRGRTPPHPRAPADHHRGNAGRPRGTPLRQ